MVAVYFGAEAARRISTAQVVVDKHAVDAATERCLWCGVPGLCEARRDALAVLGSYGQLPRRRPGATRPQAIVTFADAASRSSDPAFAWLEPGPRSPVVSDRQRPGL